MDYENIIEDIGGFGHWQRVIFVTICVPDIPFAFALLLPVFTGSTPNWGCDQEAVNQTHYYSNTTNNDSSIDTLSQYVGEEAALCDTCEHHNFNDAYTTIVSEWDLVCSRDYISDLVSSLQLGGLIVGAGIFSQISDLYGRKKAHFASVLLLGVAGLISALSINWQMFALLRVIVGISCGGYFSVNCVYPLEFISRRWRTLCGTIGFWPLGQVALALVAYLITDWRYLTAVTSCVALPYMFVWWFLPESPRWLLQRRCTKEAKAIFSNIALKNKKPEPDMDFLDSISEEKSEKLDHKYTYIDLFKEPVMRKRTIACSLLWFTILHAYYEIAYNLKNLSGDRYLNFMYGGLFDLTGLVLVVIFNNILGRRLCIIITLVAQVATNLSLLTIYALHKEAELDTAITWLALFGKGVGITSIYLIQIYSAELFPTDVRNLGVGAASSVARVGGLLAPQVLYLGTKIKFFPFALIGASCSAAIPLCLILPETNGEPLVDDFNFRSMKKDQEHMDLRNIDS